MTKSTVFWSVVKANLFMWIVSMALFGLIAMFLGKAFV